MSSIKRNLIRVDDKLFEIKRILNKSHVADIEGMRHVLRTDIVLENDNYLLFCEEIQEAVILESSESNIPVITTNTEN